MIKIIEAKREYNKLQMLAYYIDNLISAKCGGMSELVDYRDMGNTYTVTIQIDGDWKHDHGRADWVVSEEIPYLSVKKQEIGNSESDWYTANHTYIFDKDEVDNNVDKIGYFFTDDETDGEEKEVVDFVLDAIGNDFSYEVDEHPEGRRGTKITVYNPDKRYDNKVGCDIANKLLANGAKSRDSLYEYDPEQFAKLILSLRYRNINISIAPRGNTIYISVFTNN